MVGSVLNPLLLAISDKSNLNKSELNFLQFSRSKNPLTILDPSRTILQKHADVVAVLNEFLFNRLYLPNKALLEEKTMKKISLYSFLRLVEEKWISEWEEKDATTLL